MARPALLVAVLLLAGILAARDNPPDPHFQCARTNSIAHRSVFVHGYLHGYEEGFHIADLDLQIGRAARDIGKSKEAREVMGYRREFGDKRFFEHGYREGLRVGYADGMAGRSFRAIKQLEDAGIAAAATDVHFDPAFDHGFSQGYVSGQHQGTTDGRSESSFTLPAVACPPLPAQVRDQPSFCLAYVGGYRVGYSDGFTNVARPVVARAEARGGGK